MRYQLVIRKPIDDQDIADAKAEFPDLTIFEALSKVVAEINLEAHKEGDNAVATIEEL
jgi:hypothetical protein